MNKKLFFIFGSNDYDTMKCEGGGLLGDVVSERIQIRKGGLMCVCVRVYMCDMK